MQSPKLVASSRRAGARLVSAIDRNPSRVVLGVWATVQTLCYSQTGLRVVGDAPRYLDGARDLLAGHGLNPAVQAYPLMATAYAIGLLVGPGLLGVIGIQLALSATAVVRMVAASTALYGSRAGWVAGLLLAAWWEIQRRNFFLLTTSIFVSLSVIAVAQALTAKSRGGRGCAIGLGVMVAMVRPDGAIVLAAILVFLAGPWFRRAGLGARLAASAMALTSSAVAAVAAGAVAARIQLSARLLDGTVIWGHDASRLTPPDGIPAAILERSAAFQTLTWLLFERPAYFLGLVGTRLLYFIGHLKPYYSVPHNLVLAALYLPLYALAARGFVVRPAVDSARTLLTVWLLLQALFVALTFEDWSGRWLIHCAPALMFPASAALQIGLTRWVGRARVSHGATAG